MTDKIMDYKERYNEALNDMRAIYPNLKGDAKLAVEHAFPELAESEDERIRKHIVKFIDEQYPTHGNLKEEKGKMLAYLERLKTSEEAIRYVKENHSPDEVGDFQSAMNIAVAKAYDKGVQDTLEKQKEQNLIMANSPQLKEQKPAEWSEKDEAFLKVAIAICNRYSHKDIADWLKSLRPQPKQEWDDDDYVCFSEIVSLIGQHYRGENIERGNELINWLKGYEPQPSWKPSEEQMSALKSAVDRLIMEYPGREIVLQSLYLGLLTFIK